MSLQEFITTEGRDTNYLRQLRDDGVLLFLDHALENRETGADVAKYFDEVKIPSVKVGISGEFDIQYIEDFPKNVNKANYCDFYVGKNIFPGIIEIIRESFESKYDELIEQKRQGFSGEVGDEVDSK